MSVDMDAMGFLSGPVKSFAQHRIAVVIPCYKVTSHVLSVIAAIGPEVWRIYVVDDRCPDGSGSYVSTNCSDRRVVVLYHDVNQGVGGAVMTGYKRAIEDGSDCVVKVDGDGQMDPSLIPVFVAPILRGEADYTKGNRFFDIETVRAMPKGRLFGNAVLSFMCKLSSGYWNLFDPTNGYTAIHANVVRHIPLEKISRRYFFETDMLFRLNTLRAVVVDVPMEAVYGEEMSNLRVSKIVGEFFVKHVQNTVKRLFYNYYLRDLSVASFELPLGIGLCGFSIVFGVWHWQHAVQAAITTPTGTVMLAALPALMGLQFVLAFLQYDISSVPRRPIFPRLAFSRRTG
jgi:dolichol-phosphate mannosyltransferase